MKHILSHVKKHPGVLAHLEKVLNEGPIQVHFCPHEDMRYSASWSNEKRLIQIAPKQLINGAFVANDILDSFVFELANADNAELRKVEKTAFEEAKDDAERYATLIESAEWHTSVKCSELMLIGFEKHGWPKTNRKVKTLEEYLKDAREPDLPQKGFSHFETYMHSFFVLREADLKNTLRHIEERLPQLLNQKYNISQKQMSLEQKSDVPTEEDSSVQESKIEAEQVRLYALDRTTNKLLKETQRNIMCLERTAHERLKKMEAQLKEAQEQKEKTEQTMLLFSIFSESHSELMRLGILSLKREGANDNVFDEFIGLVKKPEKNNEDYSQMRSLISLVEKTKKEILEDRKQQILEPKKTSCGRKAIIWAFRCCFKDKSSKQNNFSNDSKTEKMKFT